MERGYGIPDISPVACCTTAKLFRKDSLRPLRVPFLVCCKKSPGYCYKEFQPGLPFSVVPLDNDKTLCPLTPYHLNAFYEEISFLILTTATEVMRNKTTSQNSIKNQILTVACKCRKRLRNLGFRRCVRRKRARGPEVSLLPLFSQL